jgi:3-O-methylgallate 3,4-dioxygenase
LAEIVFGAGTSHSPMLAMGGAAWPEWGEARDPDMTILVDGAGVPRTYHELLAAGPDLADELTSAAFAAKFDRCNAGLDELARRVADAALDVMIVVGDDQDEHLGVENLPPILIYHGASILNTAGHGDELPPIVASIKNMYSEPHVDRRYPVDRTLARHLIDGLLDDSFDISSSERLPRERGEGHAFGFPHRRLLPDDLPIVPVLLNTYLPPAQPRAGRCYRLGAAVARVVQALPDDRRVGVLASGGLSHFVVSEKLDRHLLDACGRGDGAALSEIPEAALQSGTSEIKNWIVAAGACGHLGFEVIDYVAGYRTPAGTGVGLAFATWS